MPDDSFSSFLLGRLIGMEARLRAELAPPADPAPAPVPVATEPSPAQQNQRFLDNLESIAGVKPPQQVAQEAAPPQTLSKSSPRFARDFSKWAEAIATGQCGIVD